MTIFYPDVSSYQTGISFAGCVIAMVKATENTNYHNPDYAAAKTRAASAGAYFCAYHFLHAGNGASQAQYAFGVVGADVPLMIDFEPAYNANGTIASAPQISDAVAFINEYRALGGKVYLLYLPHWYWQGNLGQAALTPVIDLGMLLVSSDYTGYSDTGPGWASYGGMTPLVWQYTSTATLNGVVNVDMNAYQGTVADFEAQVTTGATTQGPGTEPTLVEGDTGPAVQTLQTRLNVWGAKLTVDGDFGAATLAAVKAFQTEEKLTVDGVVGPQTWAALLANPPTTAPTVPGADQARGQLGEPVRLVGRGSGKRPGRRQLHRRSGRTERIGVRPRDADDQFGGADHPGSRPDVQHPGLGQRRARRTSARLHPGHRRIGIRGRRAEYPRREMLVRP